MMTDDWPSSPSDNELEELDRFLARITAHRLPA